MANRSHQSVLSLGPNPSPREIRLAYLRASLKAHPDHGGSNAEMVAVNEAWEALSIRTPTEDGDGDGCASDEDSQCSWETDCHSDSGSESYAGDENFDIDKYYDYGDLNETGGRYKVQLDDGTEVSLGEHEESCDCECGEERLCDCSPSGCGEGSIDMDTSDEDT